MPDNKAKYISVAVTTEGGHSRALPGSPPNTSTAPLLYVAGSSCEVLAFALTADGTTAPTVDIQGDQTRLTGAVGNTQSLTWAVALDSAKSIYAISTVQETTFPSVWKTSILVWPALTTGNVAPTREITGAATQLDSNNGNIGNPFAFGMGIAIDASDNIYACVYSDIIIKFTAGADGNATGATFATTPSGGDLLTSLFYDSSRDWLWACSAQTGGNQAIYAYNMSGVLQRTISGNLTQLSRPNQVYIGPDQSIFVADMLNSQVMVYSSVANGNVAPTRTFDTVDMFNNNTGGVAVDSTGKCYMSVFFYGHTSPENIEVVIAGASGDNLTPIQTMTNSALGVIEADGTSTSPMQLFIG
jgi:hypothetical protein